ncbi:UDP-N-acetylmuramoyl-tripeptide--D-alanyl-D-alanine ligase [Methylomonas sp. AM2-LC]|uniref:UDP-N-acetylmuramoyl-tripeptide--D-alanyl-D- alanine ligase n=1 Tax=Methylomonas sp. AM2-LC TaxID=3153301 RepID=UPI003263BED4
MKMQLTEIAKVIDGTLLGKDREIVGVSIDTRTLVAEQIYLALQGKNYDGHQFIKQAQNAGASALIVERHCESDLPQIIVKDSHLALAELAGFWRKQLNIRVVGITGSNGKTTVKEMIAAILRTKGKTLYTQGNLNNDIGVPLTLLQLDNSYQFAVIEMGANHAGEIAYTSKYVLADVVMITNVGTAHIEGFGSLDNIARSKGEIIESLGSDGTAVLNKDDTFYDYWLQLAAERKTLSFGFTETADVTAKNICTELKRDGFETSFTLITAGENLDIQLQLAGEHNVKNALAAAAAVKPFDIDLPSIKQGLEQVTPVIGRMQLLRGRKGNFIIDDTYNANPNSLKAALEVLDKNTNNWLILGAFAELGTDSLAIHREIGEMIKSMPVERLFAVGRDAKQTVEAFGCNGQFYDSQEQLLAELNKTLTGKETLLVKGSRSQKMENVVAALVDNFRAA